MATPNKYISFLKDPSVWLLLASNLLTIYFAATGGISLITVLWIYWFQSVVIGIFNFIRILELKDYSTEDVRFGGQQPEPSSGFKIAMAFFFAFHYGFFHLGYLIFLIIGLPMATMLAQFNGAQVDTELISSAGPWVVLVAAGAFFVNHLFSYLYNRKKESKKQKIGTVMTYPYLRIIPMHLMIVFGLYTSGGLLIFLVLKTIADIVMHIIEHRAFRTGA